MNPTFSQFLDPEKRGVPSLRTRTTTRARVEISELTDEKNRRLASKPHHIQAMVAAFPNGIHSRELAVEIALKMERSGAI